MSESVEFLQSIDTLKWLCDCYRVGSRFKISEVQRLLLYEQTTWKVNRYLGEPPGLVRILGFRDVPLRHDTVGIVPMEIAILYSDTDSLSRAKLQYVSADEFFDMGPTTRVDNRNDRQQLESVRG